MLSELQKQKLVEFNQDELMRDTVFKVLYSFVELNESLILHVAKVGRADKLLPIF